VTSGGGGAEPARLTFLVRSVKCASLALFLGLLSRFPTVANHPSAEKRNRQRIKRTLRNRGMTSAVRTLVKRVRTALHAKDKEAATTALKAATVALDKAATKGGVHPKAASRTISRLSAQVNRLAAK
jgi:small subunit ribosomal protein S20